MSEETDTFDVVAFVMDYEDGALPDSEILTGFAYLIRTGLAWSLQGHYGRMAAALIDGGYITAEGEILVGESPC